MEGVGNVGIKAKVTSFCDCMPKRLFYSQENRTVTLLFLLFLLFDIKPEQKAKSYLGLSVLPLPAHKELWQANEEEYWRRGYDEMLKAREGRGYLRYEDLRDLREGKISEGR
jgi:hypothetical protein